MQLATGARPISPGIEASSGRFPGREPGRTAALERAFDQHHSLVYKTAWRITGNAADAEDVLQTVFLRLSAMTRSETTRDGEPELMENPEGYLRRAAVNASINLIQLRARQNVSLGDAPEPRAADDRADLRDVLRRAMATLTGRTAEMFALRFLEGHSNGEIGGMFGVSPLVVAVTLHRARRQLQKEIEKLGGRK